MNITLSHSRLSESDIDCIHAFFAPGRFISNGVTLADLVDQAADVDKNFFPGGSINDKAKAFGGVEKFNCTGTHCKKEKM